MSEIESNDAGSTEQPTNADSAERPADETGDKILNEGLKRNVKETATWLRFLFMLLFIAILWVTSFVLGAVVLLQFLTKLFTGDSNRNLQRFGNDLSVYVYDALRYLTFNTEVRPFPFDEWKASSGSDDAG